MLCETNTMEIQTQTSNKDALLNALKALGVSGVVVTYSGSGDSGDLTEITATPKRAMKKILAANVTLQRVHGDYVEGQWQYAIKDKQVRLDEAISEFAMQGVDLHHGGWENNDGGSGTFEITVKSSEFVLEHRQYYTESDSYVYNL